MNEQMKDELAAMSISDLESPIVNEKVKEFSDKVFSKIKAVGPFILCDEKDEYDHHIFDLEHISKTFQLYSGFENFQNEIRICDYIDVGNVSQLPLALKLLETLKKKLQKEHPNHNFFTWISSHNLDCSPPGTVEIRFHVFRENEGMILLTDDLDGYDNSLLVEKF
ncbi:MAG: hypothetical protein LBU57_01195 [Dysgonamonadaceae bacterium]|jgi:hypothetical protein|nr:hypothetical protein [Dysgonamonadaceae bacterium]